jgi:Flp pilus assembly protein TadD
VSSGAGSLIGRTFLHPALDYLLIGGVASLVVAAIVLGVGDAALVTASTVHLCVLFSNSAHFASSTVHFRRAIAASEPSADAHNGLAIVLARSGRLKEAVVEAERAVAVEPDHEAARQNLEHLRHADSASR